jgi:hypothetical protein
MNLESVNLGAVLAAKIIPADPLASGSYDLGLGKKAHVMSLVNQLYALKVTALTAFATLDLDAGTITGGGVAPVISGGTGKDPDGATVDLNFVHSIQIRNTANEPLIVEVTGWTGGDAPFDTLTIPPLGEVLFALPGAGVALTAGTLVFTPDESGGFEFIVLGKN